MLDPVLDARARLGAAARWGTQEDVTQARKALAQAKLLRAVNDALAAAPPLSAEARAELARLIASGGTA